GMQERSAKRSNSEDCESKRLGVHGEMCVKAIGNVRNSLKKIFINRR
ncbi:10921_t:CDS:1, partial [Cetraspora pellucida]